MLMPSISGRGLNWRNLCRRSFNSISCMHTTAACWPSVCLRGVPAIMPRDPRYDILFEPVKIGPVTAKNRFYQVPHCNGMGYRDATSNAVMRQIKAEGGWG